MELTESAKERIVQEGILKELKRIADSLDKMEKYGIEVHGLGGR